MSNAVKASMDSVLGVIGVANYFRGLSRDELKQSKLERDRRIRGSKQFRKARAINRMPRVPVTHSHWSRLWHTFVNRTHLRPQHRLPVQPLSLQVLSRRSEAARVSWLGHSSLFIEMKRTRILIDPVFEFASPLIAKPFYSRNLSSPVHRESLPLPDIIVISHDHYDHLEKSTIKYFADKVERFFVPLGVGQHLENWGVKPSKITEFDWWQSEVVNGITLTATPANHNSGRTGWDQNRTLWCSWALQSDKGALFFSGDSAYDRHFTEIRQRLGKFDIAFLEVAANVKQGIGYPVENSGHMQACHTMKAFHDLGAKRLFPVHWSTFALFAHRWDEPIEDLLAEAEKAGQTLMTPMIGQTVYVRSTGHVFKPWWQPVNQPALDFMPLIDAEMGYQEV